MAKLEEFNPGQPRSITLHYFVNMCNLACYNLQYIEILGTTGCRVLVKNEFTLQNVRGGKLNTCLLPISV